jgi:hypothetical protein
VVDATFFFDKYIIEILSYADDYSEEFKDPSRTHLSLSYITWYNAKRESQLEWPDIYTKETVINIHNAIEFPKNSGIYYAAENKYIGLALRHDGNKEKYLPKVYIAAHANNENTILYKYINNISIDTVNEPVKVSHLLRSNKNIKFWSTTKRKPVDPADLYTDFSFDGTPLSTVSNADTAVYRSITIGSLIKKEIYDSEIECQLLNSEGKCIMVLLDEEWIVHSSPRLRNVISIPYNYKQIVHDYCRLERLDDGPYMDLGHIGIVNERGKDRITFPFRSVLNQNNLYLSKTLETHRLMTFKIKPYVIATTL